MPYPNQHAGRVIDPNKFEKGSFRTKEITPGVSVIMGKLKGQNTMTTQAYRFSKEKFTEEQAKTWLKKHKVKTSTFEPAKKDENDFVLQENENNIDYKNRIDFINGDIEQINDSYLHLDVFDKSKLFLTDEVYKTPEGFLKTRAIVTNTGIFKYLTKDGKILLELRPPEEVFKEESINSLKNIPITDNHPNVLVNSDNIEELQKKGVVVGFTGSDVRYDGHAISVDLTITNDKMIKKIESGEQRALSCGYTTNLDFSKTGYAFGNNEYNSVQRDIIYNHVAVVPNGRAGDLAKIPLTIDSADNLLVQIIEENKNDSKKEEKMADTKTTTTLNVDGINYDVERDIAKHINTLQKTNDSNIQKIADLETKVKEGVDLQAKFDALTAEHEKLKKDASENSLDEAEIQKRVESRIALLKVADHLEIKHENVMSDKDIKLAVIKKRNDIDLSDKEDAYINTYFDCVNDSLQAEIKDEKANKNKKTVLGDYANIKKQTQTDSVSEKQKKMDEYKAKVLKEANEYKGAVSVQ